MSTEQTTKQQIEEKRRETENTAAQEKVDALNKELSGKGLRNFYGRTRGKGSTLVFWKQFDESQPDTLPSDLKEFMSITGLEKPEQVLPLLITGFNDQQYTQASDPIAEFVNPAWSDDVQLQFRTVVRNYSRGAEVSIEDAVNLIKPGFDKKYSTAA